MYISKVGNNSIGNDCNLNNKTFGSPTERKTSEAAKDRLNKSSTTTPSQGRNYSNDTHKTKNTGNASNFWETFCSVISAFFEVIGTIFCG
jgi:hypothetical protein